MKYDVRLGLDTLYFGLRISSYDFKEYFEEIKKNLFFKLDLNTKKSRSKYYCMEAVNEANGFFCFFSPHQNLANDYVTIQLTGKFFREKSNLESLYSILDFFNGFVRYQRVDVALDILYLEMPPKDGINESRNLGFPMPRYSENWHNVKLPFTTYGRYKDGYHYLNMVSVGKGDLVLRVYDKDLDLLEKYGLTYDKYYGFEKSFERVFRIEYQMRGDSLREFCNNCLDLDIDIFDIDKFCGAVMSCLFNKFKFDYIDDVSNPLYIQTSSKRVSTLEGRIMFHKNKAGIHYFVYDDLLRQKKEKDLIEDELLLEKKQVRKFVESKVRKDTSELRDFWDLSEIDFEKAVKNQTDYEFNDVPF